MKIFLLMKHAPERRRCKLPFEDADHAVAEGACPYCNVSDAIYRDTEAGRGTGKKLGFKVAGSGRRPSDDDRAWEADAGCLACKAHVGTLRVEPNTLFGVREDERVLRGRVRVY